MVRSGYTVLSSVLGKAGIKRNKVSGKGNLSKNKQTNKQEPGVCSREPLLSKRILAESFSSWSSFPICPMQEKL